MLPADGTAAAPREHPDRVPVSRPTVAVSGPIPGARARTPLGRAAAANRYRCASAVGAGHVVEWAHVVAHPVKQPAYREYA